LSLNKCVRNEAKKPTIPQAKIGPVCWLKTKQQAPPIEAEITEDGMWLALAE